MPEVRVHYPKLQVSEMILATNVDGWRPGEYGRHFDPSDSAYVFTVDEGEPFFFKPALRLPDGTLSFSVGQNYVLPGQASIYPYFDETEGSSIEPVGRYEHGRHSHTTWLYTPPGAVDNPLKRYPLLIMHDGQNVFTDWGWDMQGTLDLLMRTQVIDKMLVLAVENSQDFEMRNDEYGNNFKKYRDFLLDRMTALEDQRLPGAENVAVMGSSMGGLISLLLSFDRPDIFGKCAGLSPSLLDEPAFREELPQAAGIHAAEVLRSWIAESSPDNAPLRIYLDAGINEQPLHDWMWLTYRQMVSRGFGPDRATCLSFPGHGHNEASWKARCHLPLQFLFD